ncbi:hypothetical protein B0T19DRAFT_178260 [Cercophora scortea]|uniref:Rhodopsin domain-containing protein n=1 Tax=Cercophora scortea TaxID=314031 RepID=A0AAE0MEC3_9PEZI|nr:hypothetical protein B0T19DRAFT_178260 [Cercophora scortea]
MGWTYNTSDPDAPTIGPQITGVAAALTAVSLITVCLRMYVRGVLIKAIGADDWIVILAWICSAGFAVLSSIQSKWGLGLADALDLPPENIRNFGIIQYMGAPFYITSILAFKLSLLYSYLRFIPKGVYYKATIGIIVCCTLFHFSFLMVQVNLCQPIAKQWDQSLEGSCLEGVPVYTTMASITILFDVAVMLLPFPVLLKSRIQNRKKAVLLGLFGLGMFITVIQIIRIQTVKKLVHYTDSAPLILWSTVETNLGIIVASVPTLAPLVKYFSERSQKGTGSGRKTGYPSHDIGSRYAMQTWKSGRAKGSTKLDSGNDLTDSGSLDGNLAKNNSTEFILDREPEGIVKKTEITVTSNEASAPVSTSRIHAGVDGA